MFYQLVVYLLISVVVTNYIQYSPDGIKNLYCPDSCFINTPLLEQNNCCACDAVPIWEHTNLYLQDLSIEFLNAAKTDIKIMMNPSITTYRFSMFIYVNGTLKTFPQNICDFSNLVKIDVSGNQFQKIGNVSCLFELDTLVMKNNKISSLSNETFASLRNLRIVDLSYNLITSMDFNVYHNSFIFSLILDGNKLKEMDVASMFKFNKTACGSSVVNNEFELHVTNVGNFQLHSSEATNFVCNNFDLTNVTVDNHPIITVSQYIDSREFVKYAPCGEAEYVGSKVDCNCQLSELVQLGKDDFSRFMSSTYLNELSCHKPARLVDIKLGDLLDNHTIQDMLICDIDDYCPKNGDCKCTCISQPSQRLLIVDCSNQSCTNFPEIVPETKFDILLNMTNNKLNSLNTDKYYFPKLRVLDLTGNYIENIDNNISILEVATEIILPDHRLTDLPKSIQLLDPNVFQFGNNGIPCTCDNLWIGEWRSIKNASKHFPRGLFCSNFKGSFFEDQTMWMNCDEIDLQWLFYAGGIFVLCMSLLITFFCLGQELLIKRRLLMSSKSNIWKIDIYISFDDDNDEIRSFVLVDLDKFFRKSNLTTYIHCRDAWLGYNEEENVVQHIAQCKYILIIHSNGMYNIGRQKSVRRFEFKHAWNCFLARKVHRIYLLQFDNVVEKFMSRKTKALIRMGLSFDVCNRKLALYNYLRSIFDEPILVHSKYEIKRKLKIKADLFKKDAKCQGRNK